MEKNIETLKTQQKSATGSEVEILKIKIDYMEERDMAVIVSSSQKEVDDFRKKGFDILPIQKAHTKRRFRPKLQKSGVSAENCICLRHVNYRI